MLHRHSASVLVLVILSTIFVGCGSDEDDRYQVSGTVSYKGKSAEYGTITFLTNEGNVVSGTTIEDGKFEIPAESGLQAGMYKVSISIPDKKGATPDVKEDELPGPSTSRKVKETLPTKYNRSTELKAEVTADGSNEFSFDLK